MTASPTPSEKQSFLETLKTSPRAQKRALIASVAIFAIGAAALVSTVFWNTSDTLETPIRDEAATVLEKQVEAPLAPEVKRVATAFILNAVARRDIGSTYDITHVDMRGTMTRAEWAKGNIPVVPYPVDAIADDRWTVDLLARGRGPARGAALPRKGLEGHQPAELLHRAREGRRGRERPLARELLGAEVQGARPAHPVGGLGEPMVPPAAPSFCVVHGSARPGLPAG